MSVVFSDLVKSAECFKLEGSSASQRRRLIRTLCGDLHSAWLTEIFRLRFQVYCIECEFLPASKFQEEMESDEYDVCSTHFAAYTKDDEIVGAIRLVQPQTHQAYPLEAHCRVFDGLQLPPRELTGEVSRLVVRKDYRRRKGDSWFGVPQGMISEDRMVLPDWHDTDERSDRESPTLLLGMYREMYRHSRRNGVRYWLAAMERSLARCLEKLGFRFIAIGPPASYYGTVIPFMVDLHELERTLRNKNHALAEWFYRDALGC